MSDEDVSQALSLPSAPIARLIDQLLGDNDAFIAAAVEAQTAGRLQDMVVYIERLQSNLMRLGKLYDLHALYGGPMPERRPIPTSAAGADFWKLLEHSARQTILAQVRGQKSCSTRASQPASQHDLSTRLPCLMTTESSTGSAMQVCRVRLQRVYSH